MNKPDDVSTAAWEFAVQTAYPHPGEPTAQTYQRRIALARAADAFAKPLVELARDGLEFSGSTIREEATLARFTPDTK